MQSQNNLLLQVQDLSVQFRTNETVVHAVKDINFSLHSGEILGIVGESGSGKSVTSLALMGLLENNKMTLISGKAINRWKENILDGEIRKKDALKIAMIFQEPMTSLNPLIKCGKQVLEAVVLHQNLDNNKGKEKVLQLFTEVKLPLPQESYNKYPHQMSGGQKQRVMIAMALACMPDIIICDEPTTALDVTVQKEILILLKELQQQKNTALIFITHDLLLLSNFANNVLVMQNGGAVEYNSTSEIFTNPKHPYTKALISCKPKLGKRLQKLPTVADLQDSTQAFIPISETTLDIENRNKELERANVLVDIKNLHVRYSKTKNWAGITTSYFSALQNINVQIKKGETFGLVGESGCGKSTLGKCLVQLEKPYLGDIFLNQQNINAIPRGNYAQKVQIIFQDPYGSLNPRITIGQTIIEPLHVYNIGNKKDRVERVRNTLQKIGLSPDYYSRYPHEFSGGQRQRIGIARALVLNPELLICDESVSALDVSVQAQVLNLLNDLRAEFDLTLLFISHDMSVVNHLCDRVAVMQNGKIVECQEVHSLFAQPQQLYTKNLLEAVPKLYISKQYSLYL
jgi:peptide/nickel transport system ATP-binding protein